MTDEQALHLKRFECLTQAAEEMFERGDDEAAVQFILEAEINWRGAGAKGRALWLKRRVGLA